MQECDASAEQEGLPSHSIAYTEATEVLVEQPTENQP